jgi:SAM-dependent methyltransferase
MQHGNTELRPGVRAVYGGQTSGAGRGGGMKTDQKYPPVLDACCGSKMFWFDKADPRCLFVDKRSETHTLPDVSSAGGSRELVISPDMQADFTALPFHDNTFALVVFDPPHFERNGARSWVGLKYGTLAGDWTEMLRAGFAECFRVLRPEGTLIFKWCADEIPVSRILALTPERPLFGHKSGKQSKTHWIAFLKPADRTPEPAPAIRQADML